MVMVSRRTLLRRIEKVWNQCDESDKAIGSVWYAEANEFANKLADDYGLPLDSVIAVIANTSPRLHWKRNKKVAEIICAGGVPSGVMGMCLVKAAAALKSDNPVTTVKGPKTEAFFQNINGNSMPVTIDTWVLKAIGLDEKDLTIVNYREIARAFQTYAARLAIEPSTLQAIVWTYAKRTIKRAPRKASNVPS